MITADKTKSVTNGQIRLFGFGGETEGRNISANSGRDSKKTQSFECGDLTGVLHSKRCSAIHARIFSAETGPYS